MILIKKFSAIAISLFVASSVSASSQLEILPFTNAGYTSNFAKSFEIEFDMKISEADQVIDSKLNLKQSPGTHAKLFEKDWISVSLKGDMFIEKEQTQLNFIDYYHPVTKLLHYTIDLNDKTITTYQWANFPKYLRIGERARVGTVNERTESGELTSYGNVDIFLNKTLQGFEFCTIEMSLDIESKENSLLKDCDEFDLNKNIIGTNVEVKTAGKTVAKAKGRIKIY